MLDVAVILAAWTVWLMLGLAALYAYERNTGIESVNVLAVLAAIICWPVLMFVWLVQWYGSSESHTKCDVL